MSNIDKDSPVAKNKNLDVSEMKKAIKIVIKYSKKAMSSSENEIVDLSHKKVSCLILTRTLGKNEYLDLSEMKKTIRIVIKY